MPYDLTLWNDTSFYLKKSTISTQQKGGLVVVTLLARTKKKPLLLGLYKQSFENPSNFYKVVLVNVTDTNTDYLEKKL